MPYRKVSLELIKTHIESKNGTLLTDEYKGCNVNLHVRCNECGYEWKPRWNKILQGQWCPNCAGRPTITISDCITLAKERNIECLETAYINYCTPMRWKCKICDHEWKNNFDNLRNKNQGCPGCYGNAKLDINACHKAARKHGGICLSDRYINVDTKYIWKCGKCDNEWTATLYHVKSRNQWCPKCSKKFNRSEELCRDILEEIFGRKFPKLRPAWLYGLELDGYCKEEKIAFEYNGIQHYIFTPAFHRTPEDLEEQKQKDFKKMQILSDKHIDIIVIPYTYTFNDRVSLLAFIEGEIQRIYDKRGIPIDWNS